MAEHGESVGTPLPLASQLPDPRLRFACNPHLSGHDGGHEVNLRRLARDGMRLVGRFQGADGERAVFAQDLAANLEFADRFFPERFLPDLETFAERRGIALDPWPALAAWVERLSQRPSVAAEAEIVSGL